MSRRTAKSTHFNDIQRQTLSMDWLTDTASHHDRKLEYIVNGVLVSMRGSLTGKHAPDIANATIQCFRDMVDAMIGDECTNGYILSTLARVGQLGQSAIPSDYRWCFRL